MRSCTSGEMNAVPKSLVITETYDLKTGKLIKRTVTPSTEDKSGQALRVAEILMEIGKKEAAAK